MLIIRRSKLHYTASGIVTLCRLPSGAQVERGPLSTCTPDGHLQRIQGGSNMTGTDLCVNLATSVPVIFEPPCTIPDAVLIQFDLLIMSTTVPETCRGM